MCVHACVCPCVFILEHLGAQLYKVSFVTVVAGNIRIISVPNKMGFKSYYLLQKSWPFLIGIAF